jgi:diguanylate cyclase (GGDEF)-like protein/putative nucleotidyltransferase with HDIG domain
MQRALRLAGGAGLAIFVVHAFLSRGDGADGLFDGWLYNGLQVAATATLIVGAARARRAERAAWLAFALGLAVYTLGDVYFTVALNGDDNPPYPSLADLGYAGFYPACYTGLVLLVRARTRGLGRTVWLDGAIAATGVAAVAVAVLLGSIVDLTEGPVATVATNLVYPLGDATLLAAIVAALALNGRRLDPTWLVLGAALATTAVADAVFLVQSAAGTYVEGDPLDALWPAGTLLLAQAPWLRRGRHRVELEGRPLLIAPAVCGALAIGVLVYDHFEHVTTLGVALAAVTLALVLVRTGLTFRAHGRLLERSRRDSVTDALTGLGNRRRLLRDLEDACAAGRPALLLIFDLDGFKHYNDTFGHPAGDALLERLGRGLDAAVSGWATTYRLGGDEFCVLGEPACDAETAIDSAVRALGEEGGGFVVTSSFGAVFLASEAAVPSEALTVADQRLYAQKRAKHRGRPHDVLLQALWEREPDLQEHTTGVARLARAIGEELGLGEDALERLVQVALLHDIGKIAVPDSILRKPGPLDRAEWAFIERHTVVGERILAASPVLRAVGRIVRATHERWDGTGYPDRLRGEEIPLEARIVAVCDAYSAMTTNRPYRAAVGPEAAVAEVRRCAGTQFDPRVAESLSALAPRVVSERLAV